MSVKDYTVSTAAVVIRNMIVETHSSSISGVFMDQVTPPAFSLSLCRDTTPYQDVVRIS